MTLPWFRADTNLPTHDKITELVASSPKGKGAAFVYFCSIAQANANGSDGLIKRGSLPFIHGTPADATLLVAADLWETEGTGWRIRNFGTRNLVGASEQVKADEISAARSAAGRAGAEVRHAK